jgi:acyl-CoA thioesterase
VPDAPTSTDPTHTDPTRSDAADAQPGERASSRSAWTPVSLDDLLAALDLTEVGERTYTCRAARPDWPIIPGAQQLSASVVALERALPGFGVATFALSFMRAARPNDDATLTVTPVVAGGSLATARITWGQDAGPHTEGLAMLNKRGTVGLVEHRVAVDVPADPDSGDADVVPAPMPHLPFEVLDVVPGAGSGDQDADGVGRLSSQTWLRWPSAPADPMLNRALVAHLSELFPPKLAHHAFAGVVAGRRTQMSVVWQELTFHEVPDLSAWHLVETETVAAGANLASARSRLVRTDGRLVASMEQTLVLREVVKRPA